VDRLCSTLIEAFNRVIYSKVKIGEMGASSILFPCCFVLILVGPVVYGENSRNGALPKLSEAMKGEMQRLESFSGRKFGYNHRFSQRKKLVSVMESIEMEESGVLVQRRLLAENTTKDESPLLQNTEIKNAEDETEHGKKLQIQAASSKGTEEIGQNSTKPKDGSVKEIPVTETIHPDHGTLGGKDNNAERSEAKVEKLQDGEKLNSVQQPLKNRTEKSTNNGSEDTTKDENPLLKTGTKKGEDETELEKKLQIQTASSKRTEEISQTSKKPDYGSVKGIPVMETIHPDHSTLGGKDNDAERSEAKEEKIQDGETVNSVQKPFENRTEQNNNNGSVNATKDESSFLQKTETKNAEDETEQGIKSQIQAASSKGAEELSQNPIKPEDGIVKEIPVTEKIHPDHSTSGGKDRNAEISEAKKELQDAEKDNRVQKPFNNRTEQNTNNGGENIGGEPAKDTEKITEAETLANATEAQTQELRNSANTVMENSERDEAETHVNSAESQGIGSGTAANSTGTKVQKIEIEEARNLTDSANLQIQKTIDEMQKEQRIEATAIANSFVNKMEQMENPEIKSLANSSHAEMPEKAGTLTSFSDNETQKMQSTENNSSSNSTDAENGKMESSEAEALSNSTENDRQQAETLENSTEKAESAESETLEEPDLKQDESSEDSTEAEAQRTESIKEELSANSTDTMASTEFQDSTNSVATEMPWKAQNLTNNKDVEIQRPEDEYNDLIQELADLPSKFHDTAEKVADQLMPEFQKLSSRSKIYFSIANEEMAHGFRPLVGHHYAPFVASGISCIFLLLPLLVAIVVFEQIRAFFPLQKVVLLANIYLANYFATLVLTSFIIGKEPMAFFYQSSLSGYIYSQLLQGLGFLLYLSMQCFNVVAVCSKRTILLAKLASVVQLSVAVCISLHYYVTVFHRAMAQKPPRTCWRVHGVYSLLFGIICLLSRIRHGKKEYVQAADYNTDKKN